VKLKPRRIPSVQLAVSSRLETEICFTDDDRYTYFLSYTDEALLLSSSSDHSTKVGIPKEVIQLCGRPFRICGASASGVLFENALLQVGVKHEYVVLRDVSCLLWELRQDASLRISERSLRRLTICASEARYTGSTRRERDGGCTVAVKTQAKLLLIIEVPV
jgi:hypothetical protein